MLPRRRREIQEEQADAYVVLDPDAVLEYIRENFTDPWLFAVEMTQSRGRMPLATLQDAMGAGNESRALFHLSALELHQCFDARGAPTPQFTCVAA